MIKQVNFVRRVTGPRKSRIRIGWRAPLFYAVLLLAVTSAGLWINEKWEKMEYEHFMSIASYHH